MGHSKSSSKRKVYSSTILLQKSQINNLNLHLEQLEKEELTKHKFSRRKDNIMIRAVISKIEMKKHISK